MKILAIIFLIQCYCTTLSAKLSVNSLRTEHLTKPLGIGCTQPRFSWQLHSSKRNTLQVAYEIMVYSSGKANSLFWKTGRINNDSSVNVYYKGNELKSGTRYSWKVRVWDNYDHVSAWSEIAIFQMGLLSAASWKANWIEPGFEEDSILRSSPIFRKAFNTAKEISHATAYITAHGLYEASINGQRVGNDYLTPGWTSYKKRLQYQVYDVTALLKKGRNVIGVTLGSGWYRGVLGYAANFNVFGKDAALLFQLNIEYKDGSLATIFSDNSWKSSTGAIRNSEIYNGETIDARLEKTGWTSPGYEDNLWDTVIVVNYSKKVLIPTINEPVKKHEIFRPSNIFITPAGDTVVDFGQNLVGWVVIRVNGKAGNKITLSHAEVLDKKGNIYFDNLREAKAQNNYILKGGAEEIFEPHFTWQGFRFVKVQGYPGTLNKENIQAVALYSDMELTGNFTTSNPLINQLQHNIQWGQRGNFLDVPTDCPQRDERLGWTGDAQAFSRTATFNMNVNNFFVKWLQDVAADQEEGAVPDVVPNVFKGAANNAGWADVATIAPWNIYLAYGDKQLIQNQYSSMKAFVDSKRSKVVNNLWVTGSYYGDWLFYRPADDNDGLAAVTDKNLIAQCFYAYSTQLLINAAHLLDKTDDAIFYTSVLKEIKTVFNKEFVTPGGRLVSGTQTAYTLALQFDMLPENLRKQAAERLVENVKNYGFHLTTGFLGTPYLCQVLTRFGFNNVAYKLLLQESYPSWLYPVKMGATTIWERWDGQKSDSSFQTPNMNSFNHYAYGAIGDWMYRQMAGLDTYEDGAGYKHIKVKPHIGKGIMNASAILNTYYGITAIKWEIETNRLLLDVEVPLNTYATVFIPANNITDISENGKQLNNTTGMKFIGKEDDYILIEIGSGQYHFSVKGKF